MFLFERFKEYILQRRLPYDEAKTADENQL